MRELNSKVICSSPCWAEAPWRVQRPLAQMVRHHLLSLLHGVSVVFVACPAHTASFLLSPSLLPTTDTVSQPQLLARVPNPFVAAVAKRVRALDKKLKRAAAIRAREAAGRATNAEQRELLARFPSLQATAAELRVLLRTFAKLDQEQQQVRVPLVWCRWIGLGSCTHTHTHTHNLALVHRRRQLNRQTKRQSRLPASVMAQTLQSHRVHPPLAQVQAQVQVVALALTPQLA